MIRKIKEWFWDKKESVITKDNMNIVIVMTKEDTVYMNEFIKQIPNLQGDKPIDIAIRESFKTGYEIGFKHASINK